MPTDHMIDQMLSEEDPLRHAVVPGPESLWAQRVLAAAKTGRAAKSTTRSAATRRSRRWLVVALAAVLGATSLGFAGWQIMGYPGEIARIPTEAALISGAAEDGRRWWLIPSADLHPALSSSRCGHVIAAAEFISEATNQPGDEWDSGGVVYGELVDPVSPVSCYDEASWLASPVRFQMGHSRMGPDDDPGSAWGYYAVLHPSVVQLRATIDSDPPFVVDTVALPQRPDGPRFVAFTAPPNARDVTVELLTADGTTVVERPVGPGR